MTTAQMDMLWLAYGKAGIVGTIRHADDAYRVTMSDRREVGAYPSIEVAKNALMSHLKPGTPRPDFRRA